MKWLKEHKKEIISGIQIFIMIYTMINGFWFSYLMIWFKCGLPQAWWALPITLAIALLSVFGLSLWIGKEGADNEPV